ncbi:hypothetical protein H8B02_41270 [Bradyrhizobium sp. Pear77]|uniref:hypothetical protein n=1 Tax=Bradyrhizobium altum TaxID=1571202 RepID=UPI001E5DBE32|nr:hypothetical protein [Bradyrhizobium altum]MCC8959613.1 hypothetical protein [Bradyrhizobium altum]
MSEFDENTTNAKPRARRVDCDVTHSRVAAAAMSPDSGLPEMQAAPRLANIEEQPHAKYEAAVNARIAP